jgi:hypothetical protein
MSVLTRRIHAARPCGASFAVRVGILSTQSSRESGTCPDSLVTIAACGLNSVGERIARIINRLRACRAVAAILGCAGRLFFNSLLKCAHARVAKLVDATDLGSVAVRCGGSSPPSRTIIAFGERSKDAGRGTQGARCDRLRSATVSARAKLAGNAVIGETIPLCWDNCSDAPDRPHGRLQPPTKSTTIRVAGESAAAGVSNNASFSRIRGQS